MTKWFALSRSLWAAAIPLVVAALTAAGIDTSNLTADLEQLGTAVALLVASGLALRSRFKPDNAKLTALPTRSAQP